MPLDKTRKEQKKLSDKYFNATICHWIKQKDSEKSIKNKPKTRQGNNFNIYN